MSSASEFSLGNYPSMPPVPPAEQSAAAAELPQNHHRVAKAIGACAISLGALAAGGMAGAYHGAFTPTAVKIGPHDATIQLTHDHRINIDTGIAGNADKQTDWLFDTGLLIEVKGIPTTQDQATLVATTGSIITQYAGLGDKQQVKDSIEHEFATRVWHDTLEGGLIGLGGGIGILGAGFGLGAAMSEKRRRAFGEAFRIEPVAFRRIVLASGLVGAFALAGCAATGMPQHHTTPHPNTAFNGTALQGFATHGYYLDYAVDTIVPMVLKEVNGIQSFSDLAVDNLRAAYKDRFASDPVDHKKYKVVQFLSDNHCGIAMDEFHAEDAKLFGADLTIDTGDLVIGGLPIDNSCVAAEIDPIIKHNPVAIVNGNHGPLSILRYAQKHGAVIIDNNKPVKLAGLTILGQGDVMESTFGSKIKQRGSETVDQEAEAIKDAACKDRPDIVAGHEPPEVLPAAKAGCGELVVAGHTHVYQSLTPEYTPPEGVTPVSTDLPSYYMNTGTSSGAAANSFSIGTPGKEATEVMCTFYRSTNSLAGCYVITTQPGSAEVTISDLQAPLDQVVPPPDTPVLAGPK